MAPTKEFLRYGDVVNWLDGEGISIRELRKLLEIGLIKGRPLRPDGRNYYFRSEIQRDVFEKVSNGANGHTNGKQAA
jgi:hypothetical protein